MTVVLTQTSVGAKHTAAVTWASILILLWRICLIFCPTVGITNRNILRHIQGLDWISLRIRCSNKYLFNYHRNAVRSLCVRWESHCITIALLYQLLSAKFSFAFYAFFTAPGFKNSYILTGIYFIFQKKRPEPNLKVFQYQIWTSVKKWEK